MVLCFSKGDFWWSTTCFSAIPPGLRKPSSITGSTAWPKGRPEKRDFQACNQRCILQFLVKDLWYYLKKVEFLHFLPAWYNSMVCHQTFSFNLFAPSQQGYYKLAVFCLLSIQEGNSRLLSGHWQQIWLWGSGADQFLISSHHQRLFHLRIRRE